MPRRPSNTPLRLCLEQDYVKAIRALKSKHDAELTALLITSRRGMSLADKPHPPMLAGTDAEAAYKMARDTLIASHDAEYDAVSAPHIAAIDWLRKKEGVDNVG